MAKVTKSGSKEDCEKGRKEGKGKEIRGAEKRKHRQHAQTPKTYYRKSNRVSNIQGLGQVKKCASLFHSWLGSLRPLRNYSGLVSPSPSPLPIEYASFPEIIAAFFQFSINHPPFRTSISTQHSPSPAPRARTAGEFRAPHHCFS